MKKYITQKCREDEKGEHYFAEKHGLGIVTRVCMNCGLKEFRYTGATLGMTTNWSFDGWKVIETD